MTTLKEFFDEKRNLEDAAIERILKMLDDLEEDAKDIQESIDKLKLLIK